MNIDYTKYNFIKEMLDEPRDAGISAFMRIKNGEDFLQLTIESHIDFFDEIIACYNDCTDNTEKILQQLQKKYPKKLKVYHYKPKVYSVGSKEQKDFADDNSKIDEVHSLANYYNWTLSKTTKKIATKLDDDHLAVPENLKKAIQKVRENGNKIYTFSGINLMSENGKIGVAKNKSFIGTGDHFYFPVSSNIYFTHHPEYEIFHIKKPRPKKEYLGLLFLHLKYLKKCKGLANYNITNLDSLYHQHIETIRDNLEFIDIEKFAKIKPEDFDKIDKEFKRLKINSNILNFPILVKAMGLISGRFRSIPVKRALKFKLDMHIILADWQQIQNDLKD